MSYTYEQEEIIRDFRCDFDCWREEITYEEFEYDYFDLEEDEADVKLGMNLKAGEKMLEHNKNDDNYDLLRVAVKQKLEDLAYCLWWQRCEQDNKDVVINLIKNLE